MPAADAARDRTATLLAAAVREAGALALQKFRSSFRSWTKDKDSPVSEVDIAVDELLRERLMAATPDHGWLSEEAADDPARLGAQRVWIVDPIDGTRAFIAGREDWTISVALAQGGRPILGALYAPVEDALMLAAAGAGASLNGVAIAPRDSRELTGARVAGPKRYIDALAAAGGRIDAVPRVHSLALRLARVATGALDVAFAGGNCHDWDIAAADVIVHEAGGALTGLDGKRPVYNRLHPVHGALIASGRARHATVIRLMQNHPAATA